MKYPVVKWSAALGGWIGIALAFLAIGCSSVSSQSFSWMLKTPHPTCDTRVVSYRFVGSPGQSFTYAKNQYRIPASGSVEIITSEDIGGTPDEFGMVTINLPMPAYRRAAKG